MSTSVTLDYVYPGLRPFREDEEHLFFGRETQVDSMVDKLAASRFLAVVGASGSGKSSLVNCGLRPALHRGLMSDAGTHWRIAQFRPGANPLREMARSLAREGVLFSAYQSTGPSLVEIVETTLRMSKLGLIDIYQQAYRDNEENLLVIVDQFEELFRYRGLSATGGEWEGGATEESLAFVNLLLEVRAQHSCPLYVVLTMRSDFLGDCAQFPGLPDAINQGQYLVPRMSRADRRAAIVGPAAVGGAEVHPVLLTRLVNDVGDNPDQLSILQHALNRTWARWDEEGRQGPLTLDHYRDIGTMARALDRHAERAYDELNTDRGRVICEKIFRALTDKVSDPRGIRRPTKLRTLCDLTVADESEVESVIEVFRRPSRSFLMPPVGQQLDAETVIDISHESLMRVWDRLKKWADEEADSARMYRRLAETARLYEEGQADVLRDPELQLALHWRDREAPTRSWAGLHPGDFDSAMHFLDESQAQRDTEARELEDRRRRELEQARSLAKAQAESLKQAKELARAQAESLAQAQALAAARAQAARRLRLGLAVAVLLAVLAGVAALFAWQAKREAVAARIEADMERQRAVTESERAERERQRAVAASETAELERQRALEAARIATSRDLVFRSLALQGDPPLAALLAVQAHNFSVESPGADTEIFNALWEARKRLAAEDEELGVVRHDGSVLALALDASQRWLFSGTDEGTVGRIDLNRQPPPERPEPFAHFPAIAVRSIAVSQAETKWLAVGGSDGRVRLWLDPMKGQPAQGAGGSRRNPPSAELAHEPESKVIDLVFHPAGWPLAVALQRVDGSEPRGEIRLWTGPDATTSEAIPGIEGMVKALAFHPATGELAAAVEWQQQESGHEGEESTDSPRGEVRFWDLGNGSPRLQDAVACAARGESVRSLAFDGQSGLLACGKSNGRIVLWDVRSGSPYPTQLEGTHESAVTTVRFGRLQNGDRSSPGDPLLLASGSFDGDVRFWDVGNAPKTPKRLADHENWVWAVVLGARGELISAGADERVRTFPTRSANLVSEICAEMRIKDLTQEQWNRYIGPELRIEPTCPRS